MSKELKDNLRLTIETGKIILGAKKTLESLKKGKLKLVILASNCPESIREDVKYYSKLTGTKVYTYKGNNVELGRDCGRQHGISTLGVIDPGLSEILKINEGKGEG